jgi:hypothetical protein
VSENVRQLARRELDLRQDRFIRRHLLQERTASSPRLELLSQHGQWATRSVDGFSEAHQAVADGGVVAMPIAEQPTVSVVVDTDPAAGRRVPGHHIRAVEAPAGTGRSG